MHWEYAIIIADEGSTETQETFDTLAAALKYLQSEDNLTGL